MNSLSTMYGLVTTVALTSANLLMSVIRHRYKVGMTAGGSIAIGAVDEYLYPIVQPVTETISTGVGLGMNRVVVPLIQATTMPVIKSVEDLALRVAVESVKAAGKSVAQVAVEELNKAIVSVQEGAAHAFQEMSEASPKGLLKLSVAVTATAILLWHYLRSSKKVQKTASICNARSTILLAAASAA